MLFPFYLILYLGVLALTWTTAQARPRPSHDIVRRELGHYEERYVNTLNYQLHNETVKLIGYKRIKVQLEEVDTFEDHYFMNYVELQKFDSHFYDQASMELRIYFPVAGALIDHQGSMIEANELGEFEVEDVDGDYAVLGRKQTDHVRGVHGNIIKDGVIYLADKAYPTHRIGKVFVYDFGYKTLDHHHHHHHHHNRSHFKRDDEDDNDDEHGHPGNRGCVANHGGVNCSDKYNIYEGRCPKRHDVCMDYNGYVTDCQRHGTKDPRKYTYFVGSDCSVSVSKGHCWNEL